jgi:hypothetical protein
MHIEDRRLQCELRQANRRRQVTASHVLFLILNYVLHIEYVDLRRHNFTR